MDINHRVNLQIGYGLSSVIVDDVVNKKVYTEDFMSSHFSFIHLFFSRRAEKKAINKALKYIGTKMFNEHQEMMKNL